MKHIYSNIKRITLTALFAVLGLNIFAATDEGDIFFSKYFESKGSVKGIAIYNGSNEFKYLKNLRIRVDPAAGTQNVNGIKFSNQAEVPDYLAPHKELQLYSYNSGDQYIVDSIQKSTDMSNWAKISGFAPSGKNAVFLERQNGDDWELIDIIGAAQFDEGEKLYMRDATYVVNYNSVENDDRSDEYRYKIWLDGEGWYAADGLSYDEVDNEGLPLVVGINTNRCFLIRNSDVINGKNAVAQNTVIQEGNLGADFVTLATEWKGKHIPRYDNDEKDTQGTSAGFATLSNAGYYLINFYSCDGEDLLDNQNIAISDDNRIPVYSGATPEREGGEGEIWTFSGWTLDPTCGDAPIVPNVIFTALPEANDDIDYYAYFTNDCANRQQVTVSIVDNAGNELPKDANVTAQKNGIVSCDMGTIGLTASDEYSQNYKFLKWQWIDGEGLSQNDLNKNTTLDLTAQGFGPDDQVTVTAVFVEADYGDTLTYRYEGEYAYLVYNASYAGDIVIPETTVCLTTERGGELGKSYTVKGIDEKVFLNNENINSVSIPATVDTIHHAAFQGATSANNKSSLKAIIVADGNATFMSEDGIMYSKDGSVLMSHPCDKAIDNNTFIFPERVTNIRAHAFSDCHNLQTIDLSGLSEMTVLPDAAFARCKNLSSIKLPSSIVKIDRCALRDLRSLTAISLPEGLEELGDTAIAFTRNLKSIVLPSALKKIGENALSDSKSASNPLDSVFVKSYIPAELFNGNLNEVFRIRTVNGVSLPRIIAHCGKNEAGENLIDVYKAAWSPTGDYDLHFEEGIVYGVTADVNNDDEGNPMGSVEISEPNDCDDTDESGDLVWDCQAIENELTLFDHWEDLNGNTLTDETGKPWGAFITFKNITKDTSVIAIFTDAYPVFYVTYDNQSGEVDYCNYVEKKYTIGNPITKLDVMELEGLGATECNTIDVKQFGSVVEIANTNGCIVSGDEIAEPETMPADSLYAVVEFSVYTDTLFAHSKYPTSEEKIDTILDVPCGAVLLEILNNYRHTNDCYDFDAGNWYAIEYGDEVDLDRFSVMPKDIMHVYIDGSAITHQIYFDGVQRAKNYTCSDTIQFPSADFDENYKYLYGWKYTTIQPGDAPMCGDELDGYTVMQLQEDGSMGTITISNNTKACSIVKLKRIYLHKGENVAYDVVEVDEKSTLPRQLSLLKPSATDDCNTFDTQDWKLCGEDGAEQGGDIPDYITNDTIIHVRIDSALIEFPIIYEVNRQIDENTIITQTKESMVTCEIVVCGDDGKCSYNIPDEIVNFFKEDQGLAWDAACDNEIEWGGANIAAELEAIISNGTAPNERSRIVGRITPKNHTLLLMVDGEEYDRDPGKQCNADLAYIVDMKPSGDTYDEKYECQDFDGWYVNPDFSGDKLTAPADMGKADRTFYGRFVDKTYHIYLESDMVPALEKSDYGCDDKVVLPTELTEEYPEYKLDGWKYRKVADLDPNTGEQLENENEWTEWSSPYEMPHFGIELAPITSERLFIVHFFVDKEEVTGEVADGITLPKSVQYGSNLAEVVACYTPEPADDDDCISFDDKSWMLKNEATAGDEDEYVEISADDVVESDVNVFIESGLKTLTATFVIEENQFRQQVEFSCGLRPTAPKVDDKPCKTFAWDWGDYADEKVGIEEDGIVIYGSYSDVEPALLTITVAGSVPQGISNYSGNVACGESLSGILAGYKDITGYTDKWTGIPADGKMPASALELTVTYTELAKYRVNYHVMNGDDEIDSWLSKDSYLSGAEVTLDSKPAETDCQTFGQWTLVDGSEVTKVTIRNSNVDVYSFAQAKAPATIEYSILGAEDADLAVQPTIVACGTALSDVDFAAFPSLADYPCLAYTPRSWKLATGDDIDKDYVVKSGETISVVVNVQTKTPVLTIVVEGNDAVEGYEGEFECGASFADIIEEYESVEGYTYKWSANKPDDNVMPNSDLALTVTYTELAKYRVNYHVMNGDDEIDSWLSKDSYLSGAEVTLDSKPAETDCQTFGQWTLVDGSEVTKVTIRNSNVDVYSFAQVKAPATIEYSILGAEDADLAVRPTIVACGTALSDVDFAAFPSLADYPCLAYTHRSWQMATGGDIDKDYVVKSGETISVVVNVQTKTPILTIVVEGNDAVEGYEGEFECGTSFADIIEEYESVEGYEFAWSANKPDGNIMPNTDIELTITYNEILPDEAYVHFFVDGTEVRGEVADGVSLPRSVEIGSSLAEIVRCFMPKSEGCADFDGKSWMLQDAASGELVAITADDIVESDVNVYIESALKTLTATFVIEENQFRQQVEFSCGLRPTAPKVDDKPCKTFAWDWGDYADEKVGIEEDKIVINGSYSDVEPALLTITVAGSVPQGIGNYSGNVACGESLSGILAGYKDITGYTDKWSGIPADGKMPASALELTVTYIELAKYRVNYHVMDGKEEINSWSSKDSYLSGAEVTLDSKPAETDCQTFGQWTLVDGSEVTKVTINGSNVDVYSFAQVKAPATIEYSILGAEDADLAVEPTIVPCGTALSDVVFAQFPSLADYPCLAYTHRSWKMATGGDIDKDYVVKSGETISVVVNVQAKTPVLTIVVEGNDAVEGYSGSVACGASFSDIIAEKGYESVEGYEFAWSANKPDDNIMPNIDLVLTITYTEILPVTFNVTYYVNGKPYGDVETYEEGETVSLRELPVDEDKPDRGFLGWNDVDDNAMADNFAISQDVDIYGWFIYQVDFIIEHDETQNQSYAWRGGLKPQYEGTPTKEADEQYRYSFSGWEPELAEVTDDVQYVAQFKAIPAGQPDVTEFTICEGDEVCWNTYVFTESGTYPVHLVDKEGNHSLEFVRINVNPSYYIDSTVVVCELPFTLGDVVFEEEGDRVLNLTTKEGGCDSIVNVHLKLQPIENDTIKVSTCDVYEWEGEVYSETGVYPKEYVNEQGCEYMRVLDLTIEDYSAVDTFAVVCSGNSFTWGQTGETYYEPDDYYHYWHTVNGCDSIVILHLSFAESTTVNDEPITACDSYTWHDTEYTESGLYEWLDEKVCELHKCSITINKSVEVEIDSVACELLEWDGDVIMEDGDYTKTFTTISGCDSVVTIHLTIAQPSSEILKYNICEGIDVVEVNDESYSKLGVFEQHVKNMAGCDSTIYIVLEEKEFKLDAVPNKDGWGTVEIIQEPTCETGGEAIIVAYPNEKDGYHFSQWNDGTQDNPRTVIIDKDSIIVANFFEAQSHTDIYSITLGTTNVNLGWVNGWVDLEAVAFAGYRFAYWDGVMTSDITNPELSIPLIDEETVDVQAVFERDPNADITGGLDNETETTVIRGGHGYGGVSTDLEDQDIEHSIIAQDGRITVIGHEGKSMQVYTVVGQLLYDGKISADKTEINVPAQSVYLVKIGVDIAKVVMK